MGLMKATSPSTSTTFLEKLQNCRKMLFLASTHIVSFYSCFMISCLINIWSTSQRRQIYILFPICEHIVICIIYNICITCTTWRCFLILLKENKDVSLVLK